MSIPVIESQPSTNSQITESSHSVITDNVFQCRGGIYSAVVRVLLVEDSEDDYLITRYLLSQTEDNQFDLEWVDNVESALQVLSEGRHDICLVDYGLGAFTGVDILKAAQAKGWTIPFLLLTGHDNRRIDMEAMQAGAVDFLVKDILDKDSIARAIRYAIERKHAEAVLRKSEQFLQATIDALHTHIAVLDDKGIITLVNAAWRRFADANGFKAINYGIGTSYLATCNAGTEDTTAQATAAAIRAILQDEQEEFRVEYGCHGPDQQRWFNLHASRFQYDGCNRVVVAHENITERKLAEEKVAQHYHELLTVHRISEIVLHAESFDEALHHIAREISEATRFPIATIEFYNAAKGTMSLNGAYGLPELTTSNHSTEMPVAETLSGLVVHSGEPFIETDVSQRPEYSGACLHLPEIQTFICVPMRIDHRILGVVSLAHPSALTIDARLPQWVQGLANYIATLIERQHAEAELKRSKAQLAEAQNLARLGSWEWNPTENIVNWSDEQYRIFGLDPECEYATVETNKRFAHPEDKAAIEAIAQQALQDHQPFSHYSRIIRADGEVRTLHSRGVVDVDAHGQVNRIVGTTQDVTELKQTQEALQQEKKLRESDARYRAVVEDQTELICRFLQDGTFTFVNIAHARYFGSVPEELIGQSFFPFMPQEEQNFVQKNLAELTLQAPSFVFEQRSITTQHATTSTYEQRIAVPDYITRWVEWKIRALFDEAGQFLEYQAVGSDITAHKQAEMEIRARVRQQEAVALLGQRALAGVELPILMDGAAALIAATLGTELSAIFELQADGKSLKHCASSGIPAEGLMDIPILTSNGCQSAYALYARQPVIVEDWESETRFSMLPCLRERGISCGITVVIEGHNQPFGVLGVQSVEKRKFTPNDIHFLQSVANVLSAAIERKAAEESIRQAKEEADRANRAKSEFLSRMSHELRTPLNAILGFGQLLQRAPLEPKYHERMNLIVDAGNHLLDLINEVLDIARVESGRAELKLMPVQATDIVQQVISMVHPLATENNIAVNYTVSHEDNSVLADIQRLRQVLYNLLSNAIKYNHSGGQVEVTASIEGGQKLCISVIDTGSGIPADLLPRLFTPFDRLGAERTEVEGTGLGLALSRQLTEAMGGTIEVQSTPGSGSTFTVKLPLAAITNASAVLRLVEQKAGNEAPAQPQPQQSKPEESKPAQSQPAASILYIEDNVSNQKLVEEILADTGYQLLTAVQGEAGIELARRQQPDVILLDLHLPDISGSEVLRRLKADPVLENIPVLILSADAMQDQIAYLLAQGAHNYLTKPLQVETLLQVINNTLACNNTYSHHHPLHEVNRGGTPNVQFAA